MIRNAWHHGGPTSSFIHLVSSFCFLLPRIIIEAKLIEVGFLSRGETAPADDSFTLTHLLIADTIWTTDLDWLAPNNDRFVVQSFFTSSAGSGNPLLQEVSFTSHQILSNIFPIQTSSVPQQQQHQTKLNKCLNVQIFYVPNSTINSPSTIHTILSLLTQHLTLPHQTLFINNQ